MVQLNHKETKHQDKIFKLTNFVGILAVIMFNFLATSCGKDDPSSPGALHGTWILEATDEDDDYIETLKMTLKFNKNNTGSIVEDWHGETRASEHETYSMDFSWSTTSDSNGNDILRVSYVSGDKDMDLFPDYSGNTALWTCRYVITGKILNIYTSDGDVWVFNKK